MNTIALKASARQTIAGLNREIEDLIANNEPRAWEMAAAKMLEIKHVFFTVLQEQESERPCPAIVTRQEIDEARRTA